MSLLHPSFDVCGFDLSQYQWGVDWITAKSKGSQFAIVKGGIGDVVTQSYLDHVRDCINHDIPYGVYWFWWYTSDPVKSAKTARAWVDESGIDVPLGVWLDVENHSAISGVGPREISKSVLAWLREFDEAFDWPVGIYTRTSFWNPNTLPEYYDDMALDLRGLWVSRWPYQYEVSPGKLPNGFSEWIFWQFSGDQGVHANKAAEYGVSGDDDIDVNVFNGNQAEFDLFAAIEGDPDLPPEPPIEPPIEETMNEFEKFEKYLQICEQYDIEPKVELTVFIDSDVEPIVIVDPPAPPPVEPPVDPPPPVIVTKTYTVTAEKTLAHMIKGYNDAGYPILEIWNTADVSKRLRFNQGDITKVYPERVKADGGYYWYKLFDYTTEKNGPLYLYEGDGLVG